MEEVTNKTENLSLETADDQLKELRTIMSAEKPDLTKISPAAFSKAVKEDPKKCLETCAEFKQPGAVVKLELPQDAVISDSLSLLKSDPDFYLQLICMQKKPFDKETFKKLVEIAPSYVSSLETEDRTTALAVMIIARLFEVFPDEAEKELGFQIENFLLAETTDNVITAFSLMSVLFSIDSTRAANIFGSEWMQQFKMTPSMTHSEPTMLAILDCLSSACVVKQCRELIGAKFETDLVQLLQATVSQKIKLYTATILTKLSFKQKDPKPKGSEPEQEELLTTLESLSSIFEEALPVKELRKQAVEGLAYTSLDQNVRMGIIVNDELLKELVECLKSNDSSLVYGSLSVFANLAVYPPRLSPDQKKVADLKKYAEAVQEKEEEIAQITKQTDKRCKILVDLKIPAILSALVNKLKPNARSVAGTILTSLAEQKSLRGVLAQQGAVATLLYILCDTDAQLEPTSKVFITSGLAKLLVSTDPSLIFGSKISASVAVIPLLANIDNEFSPLPLLESFEAALALTNLASFDDTTRKVIISHGWEKIENMMTSQNAMVQRSAVELVCNLSLSPYCAEKYLDGSKTANSRLDLLVALTDLSDQAGRLAAMGALAMLSEWDPAPPIMVKNEKLMACLQRVLDKDTEVEMIYRAVALVGNLSQKEGTQLTSLKPGLSRVKETVKDMAGEVDDILTRVK
ncbi:Ring assembly protein 3 [Yarrowia sp. E02]|nr:Ring assembly protein 3 [Yarrowia sp. E02]